jgi:hypothetical protein
VRLVTVDVAVVDQGSQAMPFVVENRVGRLIEFRASPQVAPDELPEFLTRVREAVRRPRMKVVICCDMRGNTVMHPDVAEQVIGLLRSDNPLVERGGYLIDGQAVFGLQIERVVREAKNENRRTFSSLPQLLDFLSPVLTSEEHQRLLEFLAAPLRRSAG